MSTENNNQPADASEQFGAAITVAVNTAMGSGVHPSMVIATLEMIKVEVINQTNRLMREAELKRQQAEQSPIIKLQG